MKQKEGPRKGAPLFIIVGICFLNKSLFYLQQ